MITLKEAYSQVSREYKVGKIYDCGDFWLFGFAEPLDVSATAVYKGSGKRFIWFPPDLPPKLRSARAHGIEVPIPR